MGNNPTVFAGLCSLRPRPFRAGSRSPGWNSVLSGSIPAGRARQCGTLRTIPASPLPSRGQSKADAVFGVLVGRLEPRALEAELQRGVLAPRLLQAPAQPQNEPVLRRRIARHALQPYRLQVEPEHQTRAPGLRQAPGVDILPGVVKPADWTPIGVVIG